MFDIFYMGHNAWIKQIAPWALLVENPDQVTPLSRMYWLIPEDCCPYPEDFFEFTPDEHDIIYTHEWKHSGIKLIPRKGTQGTKFLDTIIPCQPHPVYTDLQQGLHQQNDWFWVVDPFVEPVADFNWSFTPKVCRQHVWQTQHPLTLESLNYEGIWLCHPLQNPHQIEYIHQPGCVEKPYPVVSLRPGQTPAPSSQARMTWFIQAGYKAKDDFNFDLYPDNPVDQSFIHVYDSDTEPRAGITLQPYHNTHAQYKYVPEKVSKRSTLNTVCLSSALTRAELQQIINDNVTRDYILIQEPGVVPEPHTQWPLTDKPVVAQCLTPSGKVHRYGGMSLWPTNISVSNFSDEILTNPAGNLYEYFKQPGCKLPPWQVVLISYHDPEANHKYHSLRQKYPGIKWVADVAGIGKAHQRAAEITTTEMIWIVDHDCELADEWLFDYVPDQHNFKTTHVWHTINPVTGQIYGYGGVKLMNRNQLLKANTAVLDFSVSVSDQYRVMSDVCGITRFNTTPFLAWRGAFRECVKLQHNQDPESKSRLAGWNSPNIDSQHVEWCKLGAAHAREFYQANKHQPENLMLINDYEYLDFLFKEIADVRRDHIS